MPNILTVVITSTVIAAIISSAVSLLALYIQYKNSLKLDRHSTKQQLSLEVFKNLQSALEKINNYNINDSNTESTSIKNDDVVDDALNTMFIRSLRTAKMLGSILLQLSYLIPNDRVDYLKSQLYNLSQQQTSLTAYVFHHQDKIPKERLKVDLIPEDQVSDAVYKYINDTRNLANQFTDEIVSVLRDLMGT